MKILQVRSKRGKLKYSDEDIHFRLDGTEFYNWRLVLKEITQNTNLTLPKEIHFDTDKISFKNLENKHWLKSDFKLPIFSKKLVELIIRNSNYDAVQYPIRIFNKNNSTQFNDNYIAFYLKTRIDCIDKLQTQKVLYEGIERFNYKNGVYLDNLEYPILFKIDGIGNQLTHYCIESNRKLLEQFSENSFDFYEFSEVNIV